jgi:hypothetical protein
LLVLSSSAAWTCSTTARQTESSSTTSVWPCSTRSPSSNRNSPMRPAISGRITTDSYERSEPTAASRRSIGPIVTFAVSTGTAKPARACCGASPAAGAWA